jgi:hypothetical protein
MRNGYRTDQHRHREMRGQGKGRFGSNHHSHMNQSTSYRCNKKHDQYHATSYDQHYQNQRQSWYSNTHSPGYHSSYYNRKLDRYPSVPGPVMLPTSYVSLAADERESSKAPSHTNQWKQLTCDTKLAKLSILPTCETTETLLGSSEDSSEDVLSTSSSYEYTHSVPDFSKEDTSNVIFPKHDIIGSSAPLNKSSTYYRDLIVNMNSGSLFAMSPRSFLNGKNNSMISTEN